MMPRHIQVLFATYFLATLLHFVHNAEYIAFYPNMPAWLTREKVYLAWLAISSVGVASLVVGRFGLRALAALLVGAYGALGLDALTHYTLALCSEHTLAANLTIWFEAIAGLSLAVAAAVNIHLEKASTVVG
ncbi:MAG: hypothetical protein QOD26_3404 [Betaproteobacteria bacterium]|jgi:hypothetical protein|nr:hypothetical protein [Betaproteobacteria bacterium]